MASKFSMQLEVFPQGFEENPREKCSCSLCQGVSSPTEQTRLTSDKWDYDTEFKRSLIANSRTKK
jgi:hypothetical protein